MKISKRALILALAFSLLTFLLFYLGVSSILKQEITSQNLLAYLIFSLLVGIIVGLLASLRHRYGFYIFTAAYLLGMGSMMYSFSLGMTGWGDLVGLLQMFMIVGAGLAVAIIVEIFIFFRDKKKI